jgi:hypothetical protein
MLTVLLRRQSRVVANHWGFTVSSDEAEGIGLVRCKAGGETVGLVVSLGWPQVRPLGHHWVWDNQSSWASCSGGGG